MVSIPVMATRSDQNGWLIERPGLPHGRRDMITTDAARDLIHLCRPAALRFSMPEIWIYQGRIRASSFRGPYRGAALILTGTGIMELVAASNQGSLAHFSYSDAFGWQGPVLLPGEAAGPPSLIRSRFGSSGNLEVVVPRTGGGLAHFWRDNDASEAWHETARPVSYGTWSGVALIHSNYDNLEIVGICDGELRHHWQAGAGGPWSPPLTIGTSVWGRPALIQSSFGKRGNFEVVAALRNGGLMHVWRDNDTEAVPWSDPIVFGQAISGSETAFDDVTLLESDFGRLEVMARSSSDGRLRHFRRGAAAPWERPIDVLMPKGKYDE
jgi:hypothetical protein